MALRRPRPTAEQRLETELDLGQVLAELQSLNGKVDGLVSAQETLKVNLLGGVESDTEHGRLPRVESGLREHDHRFEKVEGRVKVIEDDKIRWKAYAAAAAGIGGFFGALLSIGVQIIMLLLKR